MDIKLINLSIRNFQGIKEFTLECDGKDIMVRGDNATGKTTIKNAFMWMLFNKNSKGNTKFGFKPRDAEGNNIHGLETSVEGCFTVDGQPKTFKRSVTEKVSTVRGTNTKNYKDVSEWFVDGVPKKKGEYETAVSQLIDEDIFKMITDPLYFNTQMKWEDRRQILMDICGDIPDADILQSSEELQELIPLLEGRTVDDYKEIVKHRIAPVSDELKKIPVQIDEAERAKPSADELEYDEGQYQYLVNLLNEKENELSDIRHGEAITKAKTRLAELNKQLQVAQKPFDESTSEHAKKIVNNNYEVYLLNQSINDFKSMISKVDSDIKINTIERQKLSREWDEVFSKEFTGNICPTCKRELPEDEVEAHKKEFNIKKASDLDTIEEKLNVFKSQLADIKKKQDEYNAEIRKHTEAIEKYNLDSAQEDKKLVEERNAYNAEQEKKVAKLKEEISQVESEINNIESNSSEMVENLEATIAGLKDEKNAIDTKVANKAFIEKQDKRINELKATEKNLAIEYEQLQKQVYLCEEFTRAKAEMLTDRINAHFTLAKFKLFEIQKNEGIKETCEVTYDGIPYSDLNNAGCINIGLDIINTLCKVNKVTAPIIIDNAEAVTKVFDTFSQKITLVVDESCKTLTVRKVEE